MAWFMQAVAQDGKSSWAVARAAKAARVVRRTTEYILVIEVDVID